MKGEESAPSSTPLDALLPPSAKRAVGEVDAAEPRAQGEGRNPGLCALHQPQNGLADSSSSKQSQDLASSFASRRASPVSRSSAGG
jgi:hypothetical protein